MTVPALADYNCVSGSGEIRRPRSFHPPSSKIKVPHDFGTAEDNKIGPCADIGKKRVLASLAISILFPGFLAFSLSLPTSLPLSDSGKCSLASTWTCCQAVPL